MLEVQTKTLVYVASWDSACLELLAHARRGFSENSLNFLSRKFSDISRKIRKTFQFAARAVDDQITIRRAARSPSNLIF